MILKGLIIWTFHFPRWTAVLVLTTILNHRKTAGFTMMQNSLNWIKSPDKKASFSSSENFVVSTPPNITVFNDMTNRFKYSFVTCFFVAFIYQLFYLKQLKRWCLWFKIFLCSLNCVYISMWFWVSGISLELK